MTTGDPDLVALVKATTEFADALTGIDESSWVLPTPCADWSIRDLVDHVVGGNWYTIQVLAGLTSEDAMAATLAKFNDEPVSAEAAVTSAIAQLKAFEDPEVLDRSWSHVAGNLPGRDVLHMRLHDLIVHTWDLNEARHPPASISKWAAEWGLRELDRTGSLMSKHFDIPRGQGVRPLPTDPGTAYLRCFGRM